MSSIKASGRGKSTKVENNTAAVKQTKVDPLKNTEKEKKQPSMEQVRLATLMSKEEPPEDLMGKVRKVKEVTCKTDDEIMAALHDCDYNEANAITQLMDEKITNAWSTTTKRKRKVATNSKTEAAKDNGGDVDGIDTWEKNGPYSNTSQYPNRGYRGNRRGGPRTPRDRTSFESRRWNGRGNTENDGDDDKPRGRYRGDGRMTNGPSRGRGGRGGRGSRGPGGSRMFQNRDRGGFPREIDTWNNPETPDNSMKRQGNDDFPSPEDWDNEEYTGSLADTKVFTPSTPIEPPPIPTFEAVATEIQDTGTADTQEIHTITIQNTAQNVTIPTMVVGSNQLTPAQSEYFNQLTQQSEQSRKQASLKSSPPLIYNSTVPTIQQAFGGASISPGFGSSSAQSYSSAIATSQQYPAVTQSSFQSKSSIPYTNRPTEFTSSNYNVGNYSSPLPPRPKPNTQSSVDNDPNSTQSVTSDMNTAIKFLGAQFSAMEFTNSEKYDSPEVKVEKTPPTLNNFSSSNVSRATELPINYQSPSQSQASPSIASVLTKAKLTNDSVLQGDNSIYSGASAVTSRGANLQDLKNTGEVPSLSFHSNLTESASAYQPQQQSTAYQKTSTSYPSQAATTYNNSYATSSLVTTSSSAYQPVSTGSVCISFPGYPVTSPSITSLTMPVGNSVYHNSSFPSHGAVSNFQSYMSYPASVMQSYQGVPAGMAQSPYSGTQYGNGSLTSVGTVAYGAASAPYHNSYGIDNIPSTTSSHKISSSNALNNATPKEGPQFPDNLDSVTASSSVVSSINGTNTVSNSLVSGGTTSTATKVTYSTSYTGSKAGGVVPSIPPGVAPIMGPQYIMSQSGVPLYPPTFVNYDDIYNMQRALPPHLHTGYHLDLNYPAAPQTNLPPPATARDPFSSISDGRFSRPDNTTSPLPPTGQSLSQPNATGPGHQQTMINPGLLQTYTAAYLYPYTQYSTPALYQMTAPNPAGGHGSSGSAARQQPSNYGSNVGYNSQYDATGSSQNNVSDFVNSKGNSSSGGFGNTQGQSKGPGTSSNVPTQNCTSNTANSDIPVNIYGKSHASLSKSYDKQPFHAGGPGSFSSTGATGGSGALNNVGNTVQGQNNGPYGPHMYVPTGNVPHHMHPNTHHQDGSSTGDRSSASFFRSNYR